MTTFIHLRTHTEYSIVKGILRLEEWLPELAKLKIPAVAITDYMNLFGAIKFYNLAIQNGIKPIIGCELDVCSFAMDQEIYSLIALCKNSTGYKNLIKIISSAYLSDNKFHKPIVHEKILKEQAEGIILLSGFMAGDVGKFIANNNLDWATKAVYGWKQYFKDNYYLEMQRINSFDHNQCTEQLIHLSKATNTPIVATNNVIFFKPGDFEAHQAKVCIQKGTMLSESSLKKTFFRDQYFKAEAEMLELFKDIPEVLENSVQIAKKCSLQLKLGEAILPDFPVLAEYTIEQYFELIAKKGLEDKLHTFAEHIDANQIKAIRKVYLNRLDFEMKVINAMKYTGYFLIVYDFVKWAKDNGIPVGPGRGSGAGSLVAYALGITGVDPIKFDLLFERFLNPERVSMPDFDIDFCIEGRDKVIDYVCTKYGKDNVAQIITFGTMAAKGVVRDVGRILGYPYGMVDKIAKLIPFELGITLKNALQQEKELRSRYDKEEEVRGIIDLAIQLEGLVRNVGKHAGGVVIAPKSITEYMPIYCETLGTNPIAQFDKDDIETVGLIKFDFLGLKTLTIIKNTVNTINSNENNQNKINIETIPTNDQATYELICRCDTTAVFQLESRGMKEIIRRLRPDCFEDILALVALFRPGPLQSGMVEDFINRKNGLSIVEYAHPDLETILSPTYGIIVYQEQVMQIAQVIGGYTLGKADLLRRAMGKKKAKEMAEQREIFISGAINRGVKETIAIYLFDLMEKFAGYGFNKSHSAGYALITYQTAYLKAHYPAEFMAAVFSADLDDTDKIFQLVNECKKLGVQILPPDINESMYNFIVPAPKTIRFGMGAIKGIGGNAVDFIISARIQVGRFNDLAHFCKFIDASKVNKRSIEALIYAGAFDAINPSRIESIAFLDSYLDFIEQNKRDAHSGQFSLFSEPIELPKELDKPSSTNITGQNVLKQEKNALGFYFTYHPLDYYANDLKEMKIVSLNNINNVMSSNEYFIVGLIIDIKRIYTKKNEPIYFITLDDKTELTDIVIFNDLYQQKSKLITTNNIIIIRCLSSSSENRKRIQALNIIDIQTLRETYCNEIDIILHQNEYSKIKFDKLKQLTYAQPNGGCGLNLVYYGLDSHNISGKLILNENNRIRPSDQFLMDLYDIFTKEHIKIYYNNFHGVYDLMTNIFK